MGDSKGGGGVDTTAMTNATNRGIDLQERMYEEGVARSEPYYKTGVTGLNELAYRLGLGQQQPATREQLTAQLTPQYMTQATQNVAGGQVIAPDGRVVTESTARSIFDDMGKIKGKGMNAYEAEQAWRSGDFDTLNRLGFTGMTSGGGQSTIDQAALNAAVDAQLASQAPREDGLYGSLLDPFSRDKFQEDPSYAFRQEEGMKAIQRGMAARGKTMTPEAQKALAQYNSDLASQEYMNAYNRYNTDQGNIFNRLAAISGVGQQATQQLDALGSAYAGNVGELTAQQANAITAAQQANASRPGLFSNLLNLGTTAAGIYSGFGF